MRLFLSMTFLLVICCYSLKAHGDLDVRIQAITTAIESYPDSAALYFQRGKLRFQHEEYRLSIDDINNSIEKGFYHEFQEIYLAKSLYKLEDFESAQKYLHDFLAVDPNNVIGLNLKGRILYAQHKYQASAQCFEDVINLTIKSLPENYIEAAQSWSLSEHPDKYLKEIQILEQGLKNLGSIISLQNKLIETHLKYGNVNAAVIIQNKIIDNTKRKESAYYKLAKIYFQFKENENAKQALQNANSEWEKLPLRIRKNTAMKSLKAKIELLITKLT